MSHKKQPKGYPMQGGRPAYPTQPAPSGYPTSYAGGYPTQAYQQPVYNPQYPQYPQQPQQYPNQQVPYVQPGYGQPPPPYPGAPTPHVPQQPLVHGQFDSGARFGAGAGVNIPPPPPGVMPTSTQVAAANGQSVVMQQRKAGWFEGAQGGGYTFW